MEPRLIDLETKFAFQENLIEELRQVTQAQYVEIEKLKSEVKLLTIRMKGLDDSGINPIHEKPPHY